MATAKQLENDMTQIEQLLKLIKDEADLLFEDASENDDVSAAQLNSLKRGLLLKLADHVDVNEEFSNKVLNS